jgi:putative ABC transport system substrate-binding protein
MDKKTIVILLLGLTLASVRLAEGQQPGKVPRIGFLDPSTASGSAVLVEAFRQELSKLGWIEGKNIAIEYRFAENKGSERNLSLLRTWFVLRLI